MRTFTFGFASLAARFARDEQGANALEYALVLILVAFAIVGGAGALGTNLNGLFQKTATSVSQVTVPSL
jgi:pilus assembly protein Flp/PilA